MRIAKVTAVAVIAIVMEAHAIVTAIVIQTTVTVIRIATIAIKKKI